MKKILIIHSTMEIGGAETSLLGLLNAFDYTLVSVDLLLLDPIGELLHLIPEEVHLLDVIPEYRALVIPIKNALREGQIAVAAARLWNKLNYGIRNCVQHYTDYCYVVKQGAHRTALPFLPKIPQSYDLAISFIDPHFILGEKVKARTKIGWFHTDFIRIKPEEKIEREMWEKCDYAVNVSDSCKVNFDKAHKWMLHKSLVIENILSKSFLNQQAEAFTVNLEMPKNKSMRLLSVGRFCGAKNFDNIPDICRRLCEDGLDIKWYLIGYGADETLIRQKIAEAGMSERVVMLGKKENPYPYMKACDVYVQPSRSEGKCVAVREAQILCKPVIITNYATAGSQLTDGFDGVVVPMDNEGCAAGIAAVLRDEALLARLRENTSKSDYTNSGEVEKLYALMGSQQ